MATPREFLGVDEEPEEEELQDATSLTAAVCARKAKQEQEVTAKSLAITKSSVQAEEGVEEEEEEIEDTASTTSSQFTAPLQFILSPKSRRAKRQWINTPQNVNYERLSFSF